MIRRSIAVLTVAATLPLAIPAAHADVPTYTQYACHLPDGTPAPADGFSSTDQYGASATNQCASGGGLTMEVPTTTSASGHYISAGWSYTAPYDDPIQSMTYQRTVIDIGAPDNSSTRHYAGPGEACGPNSPCPNTATLDPPISNPSLPQIFNIQCNDTDPCYGPSAGDGVVSIDHVVITLADPDAPTFVREPAGPLLDPGPVSGSQSVTFSASDKGGGVYQAALVVDGVEGARSVIDSNGGNCAEPFITQIPCKEAAEKTLSLDTSTLPNGSHTISVVVYDATKRNSVTSPATPIDVQNAPAPGTSPSAADSAGGASASSDSTPVSRRLILPLAASHARLIRRFRRRAFITGHLLTSNAQPVPNALISAISATTGETLATSTTDSRGTFRLAVPGTASIPLVLRAGGAHDLPLRLVIRAPVKLSASADRLRNGQVLTLLASTPARGRARVAFQVLIGRAWRTFTLQRLSGRGRAKVRHHFRVTYGHLVYRFRAVLVPGSGFPYAGGRSTPLSVVVN